MGYMPLAGVGNRFVILIALIGTAIGCTWKKPPPVPQSRYDASRSATLRVPPKELVKAIQEAKSRELQAFDLGRSDSTNPGLITFKDRLGAARSILTYGRISARRKRPNKSHKLHFAHRLFAFMPDGMLTAAGRLLYRHVG